MAHTIAASAAITLVWAMLAYSLAFTEGAPWFGDLERVFANGLIGKADGAHVSAPTIPESVFFLFHLSFAIITFALTLGATAERMRLGVTVLFAALWTIGVYAPVAHGSGIRMASAGMGRMDFAGGTVVHVASGASALVAAWVLGTRRGFGKGPMVPHNLVITGLGGSLLWAGWFGFDAGSAFGRAPVPRLRCWPSWASIRSLRTATWRNSRRWSSSAWGRPLGNGWSTGASPRMGRSMPWRARPSCMHPCLGPSHARARTVSSRLRRAASSCPCRATARLSRSGVLA